MSALLLFSQDKGVVLPMNLVRLARQETDQGGRPSDQPLCGMGIAFPFPYRYLLQPA
jgi:hypothetical protein